MAECALIRLVLKRGAAVLGLGGVQKGLRRFSGVGRNACWVCVGGQCQGPHEDVLSQGVPADGGVACRSLAEKAVVLQACRGGIVVKQHGHYGLIFDQLQRKRGTVGDPSTQELIQLMIELCWRLSSAVVPAKGGASVEGRSLAKEMYSPRTTLSRSRRERGATQVTRLQSTRW